MNIIVLDLIQDLKKEHEAWKKVKNANDKKLHDLNQFIRSELDDPDMLLMSLPEEYRTKINEVKKTEKNA